MQSSYWPASCYDPDLKRTRKCPFNICSGRRSGLVGQCMKNRRYVRASNLVNRDNAGDRWNIAFKVVKGNCLYFLLALRLISGIKSNTKNGQYFLSNKYTATLTCSLAWLIRSIDPNFQFILNLLWTQLHSVIITGDPMRGCHEQFNFIGAQSVCYSIMAVSDPFKSRLWNWAILTIQYALLLFFLLHSTVSFILASSASILARHTDYTISCVYGKYL